MASGLFRNMQDFGILQPSLIEQMRSILDQYPDDGQILKELIQNAEDAKAKTIKFLFDKSTFPTNTEYLLHPELVHFQGPALYAFNDATFSEQDWTGIRTIYDSFKKDDPIKVGRFGLGFKSVFHMTDMPGILSGDKIGFLDPHEKYFFDGMTGRTTKGASWNLADIGDDISGFYWPLTDPNLCLIFNQTQLAENYYPGTLFRFPLRISRNKSELCPDEYPLDKVKLLFEQFKQYSYMCLLFLSSLESIELYIRESRDQQPKMFFKVALSENSTSVRENMQSFLATVDPKSWLNDSVCFSQEKAIYSEDTTSTRTWHRWLVTSAFAGGDRLPKLKQMFEEKILYYLPWVAVAMSLDGSFQPQHPQGHVFCFLPLPVEQKSQTGLPIHINGFFAIDQNRRHLKWPDAEQLGAELTDRSLLWNQAMLEEAVPLAYAQLILEGTRLNIPQNLIYQAIPNLEVVHSKWVPMVHKFLDYVTTMPLLYTNQGGGRHVTLDEALFSFLSDAHNPIVINTILLKAGKPVVCVPEHVKFALERFKKTVVTPCCFRKTIQDIQNTVKQFPRNETHCMEVLCYAVEDGNYDEIVGLRLLPLASKQFTRFQSQHSERHKIYITNSNHPATLFPGLEYRLATQCVDSSGLHLLHRIAKSGKTNLTLMTKNHAVELLTLVASEPVAVDMRRWIPQKERFLTLGWTETVWNYLVKMFPTDLCSIEKLFVLPLQTCDGFMYLKRLVKESPIIYKNTKESTVRDSAFSFVGNLGVIVVDGLFPFVKRHQMIHTYVNPPSVSGLLRALSFLKRSDVIERMKVASRHLVFEFRSEVEKSDAHTISVYRELLRSLPMFKVTPCTLSVCEDRLHSVQEIETMSPIKEAPFRFPKPMILPENERTNYFCLLLEVKEVTVTDLLINSVFPCISEYSVREVEDLVIYVMKNHMQLVNTKSNLRKCMKEYNLFLRSDGKLVKLTTLFDPEDQTLQRLFYGQPVFLRGACALDDVLPQLRKLGLKTLKDVQPQEILQASQLIDRLPYQTGVKKAYEILQFLRTRPQFLTERVDGTATLRQGLENISWIPVKTRPSEYPVSLKWHGKCNTFQKPSLLYHVSTDNLVGTVAEIASVEMIPVMSNADLSLDVVTQNLYNVVDAMDKSSPEESPGLCRVTQGIYSCLQRGLECNTMKRQHLNMFKEIRVILIADRNKFVTPLEVSFSEGFPPFLYQVPAEMTRDFRKLLEAMGVAQRFGVQQYCKVLSDMKILYGNNSLRSDSLRLTRDVAVRIADSMEDQSLDFDVYLPNESEKVLQLSSTLCFDDCSWIADTKMPFVYNYIPYPVARVLGVQTKRRKVLENASIGIKFGQEEKLTNRIRRILEGYPSQVDVLKELLQNADDAQATEVYFCLDSRQHPIDRIFEDSWEPLQGPALCVYNNKPFTEEDVQGIRHLGKGSKEIDPTKTGQYGVGFNTVYHLTDTPSFLTNLSGKGERLFVFDPHCKYVPEATPEYPGRCYEDVEKLRNTFSSVTECYDSVLRKIGLSVDDGTLFRFPLRSDKIAKTSEIKTDCTSVSNVRSMLKAFQKVARTCLLFLNNVRKINLCEITKHRSKVVPFTVTANIEKSHEMEDLNKFNDYTRAPCCFDIWAVQSQEVAYEISIHDSIGLSQRWLVVQKFGFEDCEHKPLGICNAISRNELQLLPRAGVAYELSASRQMYRHNVFCFLPLPQETHLPVHVNGHFALDHEARRNVWECADGDIKTEWNNLLKRHVVAHAYVRLVAEYKKRYVCLTKDSLITYLSVFPKTRGKSGFANTIVRSFYSILSLKKVHVLPVLFCPHNCQDTCSVTWLPAGDKGVNGAVFDNLGTNTTTLPAPESERKGHQNLATLLVRCGLSLVWLPFSRLAEEFQTSAVAIRMSTPETIMDFFKSPLLSNESELTPGEVIEILKYCKEFEKEAFDKRLEGTKLLFTESRELQKFSVHNPKYLTSYSSLATEDHHEKFVHRELVSEVFWPPSQFLQVPVFKDLSLQHLSHMMPNEFAGEAEVALTETGWSLIKLFWSLVNEMTEKDHSRFFDPVAKLCLIPACNSKNEFVLVQTERSKSVVIDNDTLLARPVVDHLRLLGVPILVTGAGIDYSVLSTLVSSLDQPLDILRAIELRQEHFSIQNILGKFESTALLQYFCSVEKSARVLGRIKRLPFFCTNTGSLVSLKDKHAVVLECNVPSTDAWVWRDNRIVFLDSKLDRNVMEYLEIEEIGLGDVYTRYILHHFGRMSDNGRLEHITFIKEVVVPCMRDQQKRRLFFACLRNVAFMKCKERKLKKTCEFFDWKDDIFSKMLDERYFPPAPFKENAWHSFLKNLGLQQRFSDDQLLQFAEQVAGLDSEQMNEVKCDKSRLLIAYLLEEHERHTRGLNKVKDIAFIERAEVDDEITKLHGHYSEDKFVSANGAVLGSLENVKLCWSSAKLIRSELGASLAKSLGVILQPSTTHVIEHCSNLCTSFQKPKPRTFILEVMGAIYSFLSRNELSVPEQDILRETPLVLISESNMFVFAKQLVENITLEQQIEPYVFKLPHDIAPFRDLFLKLGASQELNVDVLGGVLYDIMKKADGNKPHSEEHEKARKAFLALLRCSDEAIKDASFSRGLYLPTRDGSMISSNKCVFIDHDRMYEDVKGNFSCYLLTVQSYPVFKRKISILPEQYRPFMLSEVIHVQTVTEGNVSHDHSNNTLVKAMYERLTCDLFCRAVARLVFHSKTVKNQNPSGILETVQKQFGGVEVFETERVKEFYIDAEGITLCERKNYTKGVSVIRDERCFWKVYIQSSATASDVYRSLAKHVSQDSECEFGSNTFLLLDLLNLDNSPRDFDSLLDQDDVQRLPLEKTEVRPGYKIPVALNHILTQEFLKFELNELVGYDTGRRTEAGEPEYVIAKILRDCTENPVTVIRRYVISVGDEEVEVYGSDLYKFWHPISGNGDPEDSFFDSEAAMQEIDNQIQEAWDMGDDDRERILERLFMLWYPARSEDNTRVFPEIFHHLETTVAGYEQAQNQSAPAASYRRQRTRSLVNVYSERRRRWKQSYISSGGTENTLCFFSCSPTLPNPQPTLAQKWYRQAMEDFKAAGNDVPPEAAEVSFVWACHKCHQSAEKALKAAQLAVDANLKSMTHDLVTIASTLDMPAARPLRDLACDLQHLLGNPAKLRYPDVCSQGIPSDYFEERDARQGIKITEDILKAVAVFLRDHGMSLPVIRSAEYSHSFSMAVDISDDVIGAELMPRGGDGGGS